MDDETVLYGDLDIIGRFQLPVAPMVFLHPHEGGFQVRLGIAVAVSAHDFKVFLMFR